MKTKTDKAATSLAEFLAKRKILQKKLAILTAVESRFDRRRTKISQSRTFIGTNVHNGPPTLEDFIW